MKIIGQILLVIGLVALCNGACPSRPVLQGFRPAPYLGVWYEQSRYEDEFQAAGDCVTAEYRLLSEGVVDVVNSLFWLENSTALSMNGRALVSFPNANPLEGRLNVTFFPQQPNMNNYNILDTDYNNFAIVYNCGVMPGGATRENLWVLSRTNTIRDANVARIVNGYLDKYFNRNMIRETVQGEVCHGSGRVY